MPAKAPVPHQRRRALLRRPSPHPAPPAPASPDIRDSVSAPSRNAAHRQRPVPSMPLHNLHHLCPLQHPQMPAQVAVRQRAQLLQIAKRQPLRIRHQRRQHAQPRALVDHSVQALIREAALARPTVRLSLHRLPSSRARKQNAGHQQLPDAERNSHRPRRKRARVAERNARISPVSRYHTPAASHRPRQKPARRKHAQAEDHLPQSRQHPRRRRHGAHQHKRHQQPRSQPTAKTAPPPSGSFRPPCRSASAAPADTLSTPISAAQSPPSKSTSPDTPASDVAASGTTPSLHPSRHQRENAGRGQRRRTVSAKLRRCGPPACGCC